MLHSYRQTGPVQAPHQSPPHIPNLITKTDVSNPRCMLPQKMVFAPKFAQFHRLLSHHPMDNNNDDNDTMEEDTADINTFP
jgi:hypothetical protein